MLMNGFLKAVFLFFYNLASINFQRIFFENESLIKVKASQREEEEKKAEIVKTKNQNRFQIQFIKQPHLRLVNGRAKLRANRDLVISTPKTGAKDKLIAQLRS